MGCYRELGKVVQRSCESAGLRKSAKRHHSLPPFISRKTYTRFSMVNDYVGCDAMGLSYAVQRFLPRRS